MRFADKAAVIALAKFLLVTLLATAATDLAAQAVATQSRALTFGGFAGLSGVPAGIATEGQLAATAGVDLILRPDRRFTPSLELRGSYPILPSPLVAESNLLAGPRLEYSLAPRLHLAADAFFGRGSLDFGPTGVLSAHGPWVYGRTNGNVLAFGGAALWVLRSNVSLLADAQTLHYHTPVTSSSSLQAATFTLGLAYTLRLSRKHSTRRLSSRSPEPR